MAAPNDSLDLGDARLDDFLSRMRNAILATVRKEGGPQATPVWYHWDGEVMRMSTTRQTAKTHNIRRDSRVSICVDDQVSGSYVTLFGRAEIIEDDREQVAAESRPLLLRYMPPDEASTRWARINANDDRVVLRVRPERVIWRSGVR